MPSAESPFPSKPAKRSPVPLPSLPQPGESAREAAIEFFFRRIMLPATLAMSFTLAAVSEWLSYWTHRPFSPWLYTGIAVGCVAFVAWRFWRLRATIDALGLGVRGERIVGRKLEELRALDYRVFHDIPSEPGVGPFNIDHLIIGPAGVFVVETKTISKPGRGRPVVTYDGERVRVDGREPDRDPIAQVRALADYAGKKLNEKTGHRVEVRSVVLYPGWWIDEPSGPFDVWVLNPDRLIGILRTEPSRLRGDEIALYANAIEILLTRSGSV